MLFCLIIVDVIAQSLHVDLHEKGRAEPVKTLVKLRPALRSFKRRHTEGKSIGCFLLIEIDVNVDS